MKLHSFDSVLDRHIGPRGSEAREDFEREVMAAVESSKMAERLKAACVARSGIESAGGR